MRFFEWIQKHSNGRKIGKSDWIILILVGVLLMVVVWPTGSSEGDSGSSSLESGSASGSNAESGGNRSAVATNEPTDYAGTLEEELEELLSAMEGVGEVRVMITLEDDGETVLQTDSTKSDDSSSDSTVILEQGDDELPYITSRITPSVQGVVVVAEGAGIGSVDVEITEAVTALFGIEAHKVKVLPMG